MTPQEREVRELDKNLYDTALAIGNVRAVLLKTTDVLIAKKASEALLSLLSAFNEEQSRLSILSDEMDDEEITNMEALPFCVKIGTKKVREPYSLKMKERKYLYVE